MKSFNNNEVQKRINTSAALYGNKSANLIELNRLCQSLKKESIKIKIPDIFPLDHEMIQNHLLKHEMSLMELWNQFKEEQKNQSDISKKSETILREIREKIKNCFIKNPLTLSFLDNCTLPSDTLFMVRSTGEEDTVEIANPGGNKSLAGIQLNARALSEAIGEVAASYFSTKSLKQRLLGGDTITKPFFMPVLIQKMIGEKLNGEKKAASIVASGVIYAKKNRTTIDVAPGHGEYIVNSKGLFDNYEISLAGILHARIHHKATRLITMETIGKKNRKKRSLIFKDNPELLRSKPSLRQPVARQIASVGQRIREHYGMSMDIEFVYSPQEKTLYIVQARPISSPKKRKISPSAIAPHEWPKTKKNRIQVSVISSAGNAAKVITNKKQLLLASTLPDALEHYLKNNQKPRAVIVEKLAANASHEAAQFNASSIPVIQTQHETISKVLERSNAVVIIDPQRQHIVDFSDRMSDFPDPEKQIEKEKIIAEGVFSSSSALTKTLLPIDFIPKAHHEIIKRYLKETVRVNKPYYLTLLESFETLESATVSSNNQSAYAALKIIVQVFKKMVTSSNGKQAGSSHHVLFVHAMCSIAEIHHCLKNDNLKQSQSNFFSSINKLKAITINPGEEGLYSDSLKQIALQNSVLKHSHIEMKSLGFSQKSFLAEFLKLNTLALNKSLENQWKALALYCSKTAIHRQVLSKILYLSKQYNFQFELINTILASHKNEKDCGAILKSIYDFVIKNVNYFESNHFKENILLIQSWEKRIPDWASPDSFGRLYPDFERDIKQLTKNLTYSNKLPSIAEQVLLKQVQYLAEVIDKTIKSLKGSPEYAEKEVVPRFATLLRLYHALMEKWMEAIPQSFYDEWMKKIQQKNNKYNDKSKMIEAIDNIFKTLARKTDPKQLHPSGIFDVSSATVGTTASFERQVINQLLNLTLEDLFTLFHQNILAATVILGKKSQFNIDQLPENFRNLTLAIKRNDYTAQLLGIYYESPEIKLEYNIPLRNHSCKIHLSLNIKTHYIDLKLKLFGHNYNNRMDKIATAALYEGLFLDADVNQSPIYNKKTKTLEFSWGMPLQKTSLILQHLSRIISHYSKMSFYNKDILNASLERAYKRSFTRKAIDNLQTSDKLAEKINTFILKNTNKNELAEMLLKHDAFSELFSANAISKIINYKSLSDDLRIQLKKIHEQKKPVISKIGIFAAKHVKQVQTLAIPYPTI